MWILILIISLGDYRGGVSVSAVEFTSSSLCVEASKHVLKDIDRRKSANSYENVFVKSATCVPKGKLNETQQTLNRQPPQALRFESTLLVRHSSIPICQLSHLHLG